MILKLTTGLVITICYFIMTVSFSFLEGITQLLEKWGQSQELNIYLSHLPSEKEKAEIEKILEPFKNQAQIEFVNNKQLLLNIKDQLPALSHELEKDKELVHLLPSQYVVKAETRILDFSNQSLFDDIIVKLKNMTIISDMSYGRVWLTHYSNFLRTAKGGLLIIYIGLCFALILVVSNSIRSTIVSKREEIEILELVGATPNMIRKPFLIEGCLTSFVSMICAQLANGVFIHSLQNFTKSSQFSFININMVVQHQSVSEILFFLGMATLMGYLGSYWVVKSHSQLRYKNA